MNATLSNSALIEKDQEHMIHPLHHNPGHASGKVWVKAEGSHLIDADGSNMIQLTDDPAEPVRSRTGEPEALSLVGRLLASEGGSPLGALPPPGSRR